MGLQVTSSGRPSLLQFICRDNLLANVNNLAVVVFDNVIMTDLERISVTWLGSRMVSALDL